MELIAPSLPLHNLDASTPALVRANGLTWTRDRAEELTRHRRPVPVAVRPRQVRRNAPLWVRDCVQELQDAPIRRDRKQHLIAAVRYIGQQWHPLTQISTPGHDALADAIGVSVDTVTRLIRDLIKRGFLFCSGRAEPATPNRPALRAEYTLLKAPVMVSEALCSRCELPFEPFASDDSLCDKCASLMARRQRRQMASAWDLSRIPRTKRERHQAAAAMQEHTSASGWLAGASPAAIASVCRPYWVEKWTPADVLHALAHRPDGPWTYDTRPTSVIGWLRHRLSFWMSSTGTPKASRSQRSKAEKNAARERQRQRRAEQERIEAQRAERARSGPSEAELEVWRKLAQLRPNGRFAARLRALGGSVSTGKNADPSLSLTGESKSPTRACALAAVGRVSPDGEEQDLHPFATAWRKAKAEKQQPVDAPLPDPHTTQGGV